MTLHEFMMKVDALWAEGEVVARCPCEAHELSEPERRHLLEYLGEWQNTTLQSGLLPEVDEPRS